MRKMESTGRRFARGIAAILLPTLVAACVRYDGGPVALSSFALPAPADVVDDARVALGRKLFFDVRLSGANTMSCASCHQPDRGFEDGRPVAVGSGGRAGKRATPTLLGIGASPRLMWDGRVASLEAQALMPIANPLEMDQDLEALLTELAADPGMRGAFASAFPAQPKVSRRSIALALAAYQRTIAPRPTRFDSFVAGKGSALSGAEQRGFALFTGKAGCVRCHSGPLLTDGRLHDIGLPDTGQGLRFKTPTLRGIAGRAPYMHDGSLPTLAAAIAHYADHPARRRGVPAATPLHPGERADLLAFLRAL
ncbi:cytochrome-c peroxidase [Sandaracinobacteroides saxicola]|uniref:C-type cytochrome n=1 Tax=Sandaracinobacteroides saxicola TaxID=2759707 RepID=A0A7G5IG31_9SPHN|nr:cytochrome c peroxidase [Sandaracinobacteroides saxicola]QMW22323.1 c-type cytochrome [Sandaracinobacteroides saxicola]